ncbi:MAG: hypothetical protein HZA46_23885 [Planctomycetales bacterium]|nr:hypothetical protein [Planctomycetales bacterium]
MTWNQWQAILWLRWRLTVNQFHKGGVLSAVILGIVVVTAVIAGISLFFVGLVAGVFLLPKATAEHTLFVWDGITVGFLFFWLIGLVTELQRSELISLDRMLHLPLTLRGTFLLNYASSFVSLTLILFVPGMVGLAIASVVAKGPGLLVLFPLLFSFLLMITAVTYQVRGWLAALMVNKRRRRTILTFVTAGFILLCQTPNLLNFAFHRWKHEDAAAASKSEVAAMQELTRAVKAGEITVEENTKRLAEQSAARAAGKQAESDRQKVLAIQVLLGANMVFPPGWLAYGAMTATDSRIVPALLAVLGSFLIGALSLRRAYRTTLRLYTGEFQGVAVVERVPVATADQVAKRAARAALPLKTLLVEWKLPVVSEPCAAVALANFRSLARAPEVKMMMLTPLIILSVALVSMLGRGSPPIPEQYRPFAALGAIGLGLFCMIGLVQNHFGTDRSGFRAYVLSGTPRREILFGKNLALAPFGLGMGLLVLIVMQFLMPLRISHWFATVLQLVAAYLVLCLVGNLSSILAPYAMAPGAMKPANPKGLTILWSLLIAMLFPLVSAVGFIPLGLEFLAQWLGWSELIPVYLVLSVIQLAVIAAGYWFLAGKQGQLLSRRETRILELVTTKDE